MRTIITALALLAGSISVFACPTSLVNIPCTDMQTPKVWHLYTASFFAKDGDYVTTPTTTWVGLTYGVTNRLEAGVDVATGLVNKELPVYFNAKYLVLDSKQSPIPVVVGMYNASPTHAINQRIYYSVGSYTTKLGPRATFGGYVSNKSVVGDPRDGAMLGLDYTKGRYWFGIDYLSGKKAVGALSPGIGYNFSKNGQMILGFNHYNNPALEDTYNLQYCINF